LQSQGYAIPDYPETPQTDAEKEVRARYDAIKGSAVNPVLREGNSDRARGSGEEIRPGQPAPHGRVDRRQQDPRGLDVDGGDFFSNERSATLADAATAKIVLETADGRDRAEGRASATRRARWSTPPSCRAKALDAFLAERDREDQGRRRAVLAAHEGHDDEGLGPDHLWPCGQAWLAPVFEQFGDEMAALGVNPNSGLGDLLERVKDNAEIMAAIDACMAERPPMYMVDSDRASPTCTCPRT
jgi:isocitrate dehydrogenase